MWKAYLLVALGGALGAMARFAIGGFTTRHLGGYPTLGGFPWGTLMVNLAGCFLLGVLGGWIALHESAPEAKEVAAGQIEERDRLQAQQEAEFIFLLKHAVAVGFLGALTTFSTFAFESNALGRDHSFWLGALYAGGSVVVGLIFVRAGIILAEALSRA